MTSRHDEAAHPAGTILLVDDDPDLVVSLSELLGAEGFQVAVAANGQEALDYLNNARRPSLILLDVSMPIMDGRAFLRMKRADPQLQSIPVLVLTAAGDHVLPALSGEVVLSKPATRLELLAAIQSAMGAPGSA